MQDRTLCKKFAVISYLNNVHLQWHFCLSVVCLSVWYRNVSVPKRLGRYINVVPSRLGPKRLGAEMTWCRNICKSILVTSRSKTNLCWDILSWLACRKNNLTCYRSDNYYVSEVPPPQTIRIGMHFQTLLSPLLKVQRMVLLSSLLR